MKILKMPILQNFDNLGFWICRNSELVDNACVGLTQFFYVICGFGLN